jgi:hypothetical protein
MQPRAPSSDRGGQEVQTGLILMLNPALRSLGLAPLESLRTTIEASNASGGDHREFQKVKNKHELRNGFAYPSDAPVTL